MRRLTACIPFLALVLIPATELSACGPFPPDDEPGFSGSGMLSLFSPWCVPDTLFSGLIDDADGLTSESTRQQSAMEAVSATHTAEWLAYLGWNAGTGPRDELAEILDSDDPLTGFARKIAPVLPRGLSAETQKGVERYLGLLAGATRAVNAAQDAAWAYAEDRKSPAPDWKGVLARARAARDAAPDAFLRERCAFQAVRAACLSGAADQALSLYNESFGSAGGTALLRYRAMGYAARAWILKGQPKTAFGLYIAIFDQCPPLSSEALLSLRAMGISDATFDQWTAALDSPHRRAVAAFTHALIDPHRNLARYIEQIVSFDPGSAHAVKLLMSTIRAVEAERLPRVFASLCAPDRRQQTGGSPKESLREQPSFDDAALGEILRVVHAARAGGAVRYPGLWQAAEAHLLLLSGDAVAARAALTAPSGAGTLSTLERGMLHVEASLTGWSTAGGGSWQARLSDDLAFLDRMADERHDSRPRDTWLSLLAHQHLADGDVARAAVGFMAAGSRYTADFLLDMYGEPGDLLKLEAVLRSPSTEEDRILGRRFPLTAEDARYLAGVRLARRGMFADAVETWKPLPAAWWNRAGNSVTDDGAPPLHVSVSFENTLMDPDAGRQTLSRMAAAQRLAALEARRPAARGKTGDKDRGAAAAAAAALGNAWMSTPFLGYADILWNGAMVYSLEWLDAGKWPFTLADTGDRARSAFERFRREYDHLATAAALFDEARSLEPDREKAALWSLSAIECWDNYQYGEEFMGVKTDEKNAKATTDRRMFAALYRGTALYKDYSRGFPSGCPGIEAYR